MIKFWRNGGKGAKLRQISEKLSDILDSGSDEKLMVFTDDEALAGLCGQINRLLVDRQRIRETTHGRRSLPKKCWLISRTILRLR